MFERLQFAFPDYDLSTLPSIPETWEDVSYCNDTCPSFEAPNGLIIWTDYADLALRECAEFGATERFSVIRILEDGSIDELLYADDWQNVLTFVESYQ
jgi:hypothetical protein